MKPFVRWLRGFRYAYEGIQYALSTQRNMKFHVFVAFFALASALFFRLSRIEILFILLAATLVMVTELINTAVEKAVDLAMPESHPLAKIAKDVAAAAVLVAAFFAVAVGAIVFYSPVARWLSGLKRGQTEITPSAVWLYLALTLLAVVVAETRFSQSKRLRPSLWSAVAFSMATMMALASAATFVTVLAYTLAAFFLILLYGRGNRSVLSLLFGAVLGAVVTWLAYDLNMM